MPSETQEAGVMVPGDRAARLAGVSRQKLWYWEKTNLIRPTVRRRLSSRNIVRLYALPDLTDLLIAAELRHTPNITLQHMREVLGLLREAGYQKPLRELQFAVDHGTIFIQHADGTWAHGRIPNQTVEPRILNLKAIRQTARDLIHQGRSQQDFGRVVKRRGAMGSKPIFKGTRVPLEAVLEFFDADRSPREILTAYPSLTEEDLSKALLLDSIAKRLRAGESFHSLKRAYNHLTDEELRSAQQIRVA
jgi:uncharacterized protein (DUF433 family)